MEYSNQQFVGSLRSGWQLLRTCLLIMGLITLTACATITQEMGLEAPKVSLKSIKPIQGDSVTPNFEISLRIVNPNNRALDIAGVAYDVEILNRELVTGVSSEIPRIEAYSEQTIKLTAGVNLYGLLRLLADVSAQDTRALPYELKAKIDFNGLVPTQHITEAGEIDLSQSR